MPLSRCLTSLSSSSGGLLLPPAWAKDSYSAEANLFAADWGGGRQHTSSSCGLFMGRRGFLKWIVLFAQSCWPQFPISDTQAKRVDANGTQHMLRMLCKQLILPLVPPQLLLPHPLCFHLLSFPLQPQRFNPVKTNECYGWINLGIWERIKTWTQAAIKSKKLTKAMFKVCFSMLHDTQAIIVITYCSFSLWTLIMAISWASLLSSSRYARDLLSSIIALLLAPNWDLPIIPLFSISGKDLPPYLLVISTRPCMECLPCKWKHHNESNSFHENMKI